jgi:hypothetical protein
MKKTRVFLLILSVVVLGGVAVAHSTDVVLTSAELTGPAGNTSTNAVAVKPRLDINNPAPQAIVAAWADKQEISDVERANCSVAFSKTVMLGHECGQGLVAFINQKSTADPTDIFVAWTGADGVQQYQCIKTERGLAGDVGDFNGDGRVEIVVRSCFAEEAVSHAEDIYWNDVYAWAPTGFVKKSKDYIQSYYLLHYLPEISLKIDRAMDLLALGGGKSEADVERNRRLHAHGLVMLADCQEGLKRLTALSKSSAAAPVRKPKSGKTTFPATATPATGKNGQNE